MSKKFWSTLAFFACLPSICSAADFISSKPTPRVEYWEARIKQIDAAVADKAALPQVKLLFVGDSITDFWLLDDNPWVKGQKFGRRIWNASFNAAGSPNFGLNIGISGDRTEHVLYRLLPRKQGGLGQIDALELDPEFIVLMIGVNNTWAPEEPVQESVFAGSSAVIRALQACKPKARLIVQSLLPLNEPLKNVEIVRPVNLRLQTLVAGRPTNCAFYLDLYPSFVDDKGAQIASYFNDGIHPNEAGYRVWRDRLVAFLDQVRKSGSAPLSCN